MEYQDDSYRQQQELEEEQQFLESERKRIYELACPHLSDHDKEMLAFFML